MVVLASAGGNTVPAIARLVQADEDTIRQVIHRFNEMGMACLDPQWAGGRPRRISPDEEQFLVPGVIRGGSYTTPPVFLRTATRVFVDGRYRYPAVGFRCAQSLSVE